MPSIRRDEAGMTAVELLISMTVFSLVLTFTFTFVQSAWRETLGVERRHENVSEARIIMDNLTKDIRTAARLTPTTSPFTIGKDFEVEFYANLNPTSGPRKVRLFVDGSNRLVQNTILPQGVSPNFTYPPPGTNRILGSYVANPPSRPIFVYYDATDNVLSTPLDISEMLAVEAVGVTLSIRRTTNLQVAPTTVIDRVRLPNVDYNPLATPSP